MSEAYGAMAAVYDRWMKSVDYVQWWEYLRDTFNITPGSPILELGCGTGNITQMLASAGHAVVAGDMSSAMLAQAESKLRRFRNVRLLRLDMRRLPSRIGSFPVIIAACDAVNYLPSLRDLGLFLACARERLTPAGILLFDVHGQGRVEGWRKMPAHNHVDESSCYLWDVTVAGASIEHRVTGFLRGEGGCWRRFDEVHRQRFFSLEEIAAAAAEAGFTLQAAYDFPSQQAADAASQRVQIALVPKTSAQ